MQLQEFDIDLAATLAEQFKDFTQVDVENIVEGELIDKVVDCIVASGVVNTIKLLKHVFDCVEDDVRYALETHEAYKGFRSLQDF